MPKRSLEEDLASLTRKIKKFKRKLHKQSRTEKSPPIQLPTLDDWLPDNLNSTSEPSLSSDAQAPPTTKPVATDDQPEEIIETQGEETTSPLVTELDDDILEILGEDPTDTTQYGPELRAELAARLQHISIEGLDKDMRKNLINKYLLPANCTLIGAPSLNPEIRAAISSPVANRDKGIEIKQKQLACAISCLAEIITDQIKSTERDKKNLEKLMDATRLLCDLQHGDSNTRRNFILFAIKKDVKAHLSKTKIDGFLFGEQLSETLKSAKAVTKSGAELKLDTGNRSIQGRPAKPGTSRPLNRKAPPTRRPPGSIASTSRNYEPAQWTRPAPPPQPPTQSSRPSYRHPGPAPRHNQRRRQ